MHACMTLNDYVWIYSCMHLSYYSMCIHTYRLLLLPLMSFFRTFHTKEPYQERHTLNLRHQQVEKVHVA